MHYFGKNLNCRLCHIHCPSTAPALPPLTPLAHLHQAGRETGKYRLAALTASGRGGTLLAMEDDDRPRQRGDAAERLAAEDLAPYSQDELDERISLLEAEIQRVKAHRDKASAHKAAADALFKGSGS
jgi:uncharacterized small protein (DUF1192 family)